MQNNFYAYALALFDLSDDPKTIFSSLKLWNSVHHEFHLLDKYLSNKFNQKLRQKQLVAEIFKVLKLPTFLLHWLWVIIDDGNYFYFNSIFKECKKRYCGLTNTINVHIVSAFALSEKQKQEIATKFAKLVSLDIDLDVEIDKSLISGLQINFLGKTYDNTIKNKLSFLKNKLLEEEE